MRDVLQNPQDDHGKEDPNLGFEDGAESGYERHEDGARQLEDAHERGGAVLEEGEAEVLLDGHHKPEPQTTVSSTPRQTLHASPRHQKRTHSPNPPKAICPHPSSFQHLLVASTYRCCIYMLYICMVLCTMFLPSRPAPFAGSEHGARVFQHDFEELERHYFAADGKRVHHPFCRGVLHGKLA